MFHRWRQQRDEDSEGLTPEEQRYDSSQGGNAMRRRGKRMERSLDRWTFAFIVALALAVFFHGPGWLLAFIICAGLFGMMGSFFIHVLYDPRGGDKKEDP